MKKKPAVLRKKTGAGSFSGDGKYTIKKPTIILVILAVALVVVAGYFIFFKKNSTNGPGSINKILQDSSANSGAANDQQRFEAYKKSIPELEKKTGSDPKDIGSMLRLASAYYNVGDLNNAIATLQKAIEVDGGSALAHNNLGNLYREKGDITSSDMEYNKAITIDPKLASAYINLAVNLHDSEDRSDEAIAILNQGLAQLPDNEGIKTLLKEYNR